ncbi:phosphoadenosine phosphosulfate reductase family protein [Gracilimonas sp. Q87]|uniref:phosphoadenosine phosphosulfate reductase domain-containing protein n=1 Tax=Gracilimonas sp. Q87 TaxID=3384766 RepID=UPI0039845D63
MLRENQRTAPMVFEDGDKNLVEVGGTRGSESTRRKFPQVSPDLSVRWCSAYLKIDVCATAIRNQDRFKGIKTVVLSGERGEESKARANYAIMEPDRSDLRDGKRFKRYVDRWRPIRDWKEEQVWDIIEQYNVRAHPAYYLGWGRVSCKFCIFGNADQVASGFAISPEQGNKIADYEAEFDVTIKRDKSYRDLVDKGTPYGSITPSLVDLATAYDYNENIIMDQWTLPAGAFGDSCGPT